MPFYEYQCKNCGHALEAMQKVSDSPLKKCPHCGKSQLQRLMSAPVFRLKGKGWYETDFKGESDNKRNLADKPEADAPKEKDSAPADTKGDAKSDVKATDSTAGEDKPKEKTADQPAAKKKVDLKRRRSSAKKAPIKAKKKRR
jgi:putative FmdB family regulatory protein